MPLPTVGDLHVNTLLTNVSIAYQNAEYIADKVFPIVPVQKQTDVYASYDQSFWFRDELVQRAPGTESRVSGYNVSTTNTYRCEEFALARVIPDELRSNADSVFNVDRDATTFLTDKALLKREVAFATDFMAASVWGNNSTGQAAGGDFVQWSNYAGSNPIVDLDTFKDTIESKIGREGNKLVVGKQVHLQLKNHPDILELIKYTQTGSLTEDLLARLLGVESYLVGRAIKTTDKEGTAEASVSYSRVWGKTALLLYVPSNPSIMTPAAGYTFVWQRVPNAIQFILKTRDDRKRADFIEIGTYFDQAVTGSNAGYYLSAAVA